MTDQPTTRNQLIEQAARVIHAARYTKADEPTAVDEFIAAGLADAGLLADPEQHAELERERDTWESEYERVRDLKMTDLADALQERDAPQARIDAALTRLKEADQLSADFPPSLEEWSAYNSKLIHVRATLQGDQPTEPADVHPGRPVLPITADDFDLLETEEL